MDAPLAVAAWQPTQQVCSGTGSWARGTVDGRYHTINSGTAFEQLQV